MAEPTVEELNEKFGNGSKALGPDVVEELRSIMRLHGLDVLDLFYKWESYCIKMDMEETQPSLERLLAFKETLQMELENKAKRAEAHIKTEKRVGVTPRTGPRNGEDVFGMIDGLVPNTPSTGRINKSSAMKKRPYDTPSVSRAKADHPASSPDSHTPSILENQLNSIGALPPSSFNDRANPGEIVEVLNDHLPATDPPINPFSEARVRLKTASDQKKLGYKPMAMKLSEASEILDDRIDDFTNMVMDHYKLDYSEFGSAASQSTTEIIAVGRIASDSSEGKLNAASLVFETSRKMGGGFRIPLKMDQLKGFQVFPGQIVALKGTNASGHEFAVSEVLPIPLLSNAASAQSALAEHRERLKGGPDAMDDDSEPMPLNMIFASGPYTADDNLDFEPLHALCSRAADTYADALVLAGPFIDMEHPLIASGDFDLPEDAVIDPDVATMSTVFKYLISPVLNQLVASNPTLTILLVPSVRDVMDKHVSWPQEAFPRRELGLPKTAKIVGNPMTLMMNEMVVGISSQDILFELRHEELTGGRPQDTNLMSRLSRYLIEQRHYFPLYPPTDRQKLPKTGTADGVPPGAMLDLSYLKLGEIINVRPDVLIVPSALPPFAKVVESVLVINPGYLSKRRGAGTYARMSLYPPSLTDIGSGGGEMVANRAFDRARVEITRI